MDRRVKGGGVMGRISLGLLAILVWAVAPVEAANYYVSKTGSDVNTCAQAQLVNSAGVPTNPKLTLGGTNGVGKCTITGGDEIRIGAGIYAENFFLTDSGGSPNVGGIGSGTSWTNKIWIRGWPAGTIWTLRPPASVPNRPWCVGIGLNRAYIEFDYVYIDGDFCDSPLSMGAIGTGTAHHIRLNHAEVSGHAGVPYALVQTVSGAPGVATGFEVLNSSIHHGGTAEGLSHGIYVATGDTLVENNDIHNFSAGGVHVYNGTTPMPGVIVRRNRIHDTLQLAGARRGWGVIIANNSSGALVVNNVVWNINPSTTGPANDVACYDTFNGNTALFINNTCYNSARGFSINFHANVTMRNNVTWNNPQGGRNVTNGSTVLSETNNFGASATGWTNSNPLYMNPAALDFRLQENSPARNAGATLTQATPDIAGTIRPQESFYDAGAYEFIASNTAPTIIITWSTSDATWVNNRYRFETRRTLNGDCDACAIPDGARRGPSPPADGRGTESLCPLVVGAESVTEREPCGPCSVP